ncbi:unnamed protein product [Blepharisma stoltei]|uniref:RRM domain-containing protein n=1 Tax=Blepharisma stoltei TaxID=1481888 RepID=A0AAU9K526_9CILI|nr:unnamed protein product [Blepharisma stoltei]
MGKYAKGSDESSGSEQEYKSSSKKYEHDSDSDDPRYKGSSSKKNKGYGSPGSSGSDSHPQKRQREPASYEDKGDEQSEVFVGGLSWEADDSDLQKFFKNCGSITNIKILKNDQGKSKGSAFIKFSSPEEAQEAIRLNGSEHMGRTLRINLSGDKPNKHRESGGSGRGSTSTVFVGNLPYNADENNLTDFFSDCGSIKQVRIAHDQDGNKRGFAHVEFESTDSADAAIKLNGKELEGRELKIDFAGEKRSGGSSRGGRGRGGRGRPRRY